MKSYKKKYEELLIKQHEEKYIHIPFSWKGIEKFFLFLGSVGLAIANFFLLITTWKFLGLGSLAKENITGFHQLLIAFPLIMEYLLIAFSVICLVAFIKGGFDKIKSYDEEGLISGLITGFILGLIIWLILGLIAGLIAGLIIWLIAGLIIGLITGLIAGFIPGLIIGFIDEFKEK